MHSRLTHGLALAGVGLFAFFYNLHLSLLEGSEGLYAHITRDMLRSGDLLRLTYQGEAYANKTPFFFWLLGLSTTVFGDNEVALRLPGSLSSLGTMVLAYLLGKTLFGRTAGFWSALVVATTHVSIWYGRRVLFDATLTFFVTLAIYAWIMASRRRGQSWWYLISFLAMALGTMTKGLHGFGLPILLILLYSAGRMEFRALREPLCLAGVIVFASLVAGYAWVLGSGFEWHFHMTQRLLGAFDSSNTGLGESAHPIHWYLYVIWYDFFPWSALIPSGIALLLSSRPFRTHPSEQLVLLWVLGFFVALSLGQPKREPYLMVLLPGLALMVGHLYQTALSSQGHPLSSPLLKLMLAVAAIAFVSICFWGPSLLQTRWDATFSAFPVLLVAAILGLCGLLGYWLVRSSVREALVTFAVLAVSYMVVMNAVVLPSIDQATSARRVSEEIKALAHTSPHPVHLYSRGWPRNEDLVYYLSREPGISRIVEEGALLDLVGQSGRALIVTDTKMLKSLKERSDLSVTVLRKFLQPRKKSVFLLSVQFKVDQAGGQVSLFKPGLALT